MQQAHADPSATSGSDAAASGPDRMRILAAQTRLVQVAKAQAEELALLRRELERLRQKAFPAFPAGHPHFGGYAQHVA
jgi:hypothetical protein